MKIALLAPASSIHVVKWFNSLNELGHQVHLISLHKPIPSNPALNYEERLHLLTTSSPIGYISNVTRLKQILNTIQPDILNVHYASGSGLLGRLCDLHPMLLSVWDDKSKEALRIDLWTKDMTQDDMKRFFHQILISMSSSYLRATDEEEVATRIAAFAEEFAVASKIND